MFKLTQEIEIISRFKKDLILIISPIKEMVIVSLLIDGHEIRFGKFNIGKYSCTTDSCVSINLGNGNYRVTDEVDFPLFRLLRKSENIQTYEFTSPPCRVNSSVAFIFYECLLTVNFCPDSDFVIQKKAKREEVGIQLILLKAIVFCAREQIRTCLTAGRLPLLVPGSRFELPRPFERHPLKVVRLPISPPGHYLNILNSVRPPPQSGASTNPASRQDYHLGINVSLNSNN